MDGFVKTINTPIGNEEPHPLTIAYLNWVYQQDAAYAQNIVRLREYYDGTQDTKLIDRQRAYLELNDIKFRMNIMAIPVDTQAERMRVIGFSVNEGMETDKPQSGEDGLFWQIWQHNRMDSQQAIIHTAAALDGDTYAIVGWDDVAKMPTINFEPAWDGTSGMIVRYDPDNRNKLWYAVKRWVVDAGPNAGDVTKMSVYTDGFVYNYIGSVGGAGWQELPDANGDWPHVWAKKDGKTPLRAAAFHLANNGDGSGYGLSELENAMPMQNALDFVVINELTVVDQFGSQKLWGSGMEVDDDFNITPGQFLHTPEAQGKFGVIPAGDIKQLSDLAKAYVLRTASVTRTPGTSYQETGNVQRAETQKAGDSPLVSKVRNRAVSAGNFYEDIMGLCRTLVNEFGGGNYDELTISTEWASFESIDVQAEAKKTAETAGIKAATLSQLKADWGGYVDAGILALRAGYTDEEARDFGDAPTGGLIEDGLTQ